MNRAPRKGGRGRRVSDVTTREAPLVGRRPSVDELRQIGLFGGLGDDILTELCASLPVDVLDAGSLVYEEGERGRAIYVVLEGELVMSRRGVPLGTHGPGGWVGAMSVIDVMPRYVRVETLTPSVLLRLRSSDLDAIYRRSVKAYALLVMNIARQLSRELRIANERFLETKR